MQLVVEPKTTHVFEEKLLYFTTIHFLEGTRIISRNGRSHLEF